MQARSNGAIRVPPEGRNYVKPSPNVDRIQDRKYKFVENDNKEMDYSVFVPKGYDPAKKWPLIVMLHGNGITPAQMIRFGGTADFAERDGYIVVTPMGLTVSAFYGLRSPDFKNRLDKRDPNAAPAKYDNHRLAELDVLNVLDIVRKEFNIDNNRIYLTGHSMGGAGAYFFGAKYNDIWAAVAPLSGGGIHPEYAPAEAFKDMPMLVMQGAEDTLVRPGASRASVELMRKNGIPHVYLEVPGADHEAYVRHETENIGRVFAFFNLNDKKLRYAAPQQPAN